MRTAHYRGDHHLSRLLSILEDAPSVKKIFPTKGQTHKHKKGNGFEFLSSIHNGATFKLYHDGGSLPVTVSCTDLPSVITHLETRGVFLSH